MKQELDRIKSDVETMQKAMGLAPSMAREWVQWMKRDRWLGLWWCVPGFILIAAALVPQDRTQRYWGLVLDQWAGILVAAVMLGGTILLGRRVKVKDGRPEGLVREMNRFYGMTAQGFWASMVLTAEAILYIVWCSHYRIGFEPFWSGLFLLMGFSCLLAAVASNVWQWLGWAIPFLGYGICVPLVHSHGKVNGVLFGMMFIAVALSFSIIQVLQIRQVERQNESH